MSLMDITAASLSRSIGQTVPDIYVVIAKNSVLDMDSEAIASILGVTKDELAEIESDQVYKDCRLLIAQEHARGIADGDLSWDALEQQALKNLLKRMMHLESDPDFNLKVAAVANRASRKMSNQSKDRVLDPTTGGSKVQLTLTSRIVQRLSDSTRTVTIEESLEQVSVMNGTAQNPTFDDIDQLLGVSAKPRIADTLMIRTHGADATVEDLAREMRSL
jgi:hypothetical protein